MINKEKITKMLQNHVYWDAEPIEKSIAVNMVQADNRSLVESLLKAMRGES